MELIVQAKRLIKLLSNPTDLNKWKLVTILIGHNDVCTHPCNTTYTAFDASPGPYRDRVAQALDMLRDYLPNTFVNFVPVLDINFTFVSIQSISTLFVNFLLIYTYFPHL